MDIRSCTTRWRAASTAMRARRRAPPADRSAAFLRGAQGPWRHPGAPGHRVPERMGSSARARRDGAIDEAFPRAATTTPSTMRMRTTLACRRARRASGARGLRASTPSRSRAAALEHAVARCTQLLADAVRPCQAGEARHRRRAAAQARAAGQPAHFASPPRTANAPPAAAPASGPWTPGGYLCGDGHHRRRHRHVSPTSDDGGERARRRPKRPASSIALRPAP